MQNPDFNEKRRNAETNDLIYEGIATHKSGMSRYNQVNFETNDLIYEGIATQETPKIWLFLASQGTRNKRPDLRRDCDLLPARH